MYRDPEAIAYVLSIAKERDVRFIRLWFTDILGILKGVAITSSELQDALELGVPFDGGSIEGFARQGESDMIALPDPSTFRILPWRPQEYAVAGMFCDILTPEGEPFSGDPRYVLRRNLEEAAELGYSYYVGPELEYYYFKDSTQTDPLDSGSYFDQTPLDLVTDLRRETVLFLETLGIPVETSHHEVSDSQHEIDLRYTDALTMADTVMMYRLVVKEVAMRHGVYATFMPKPINHQNGSGMHTHQALFNGEVNTFADENDPWNLSVIGKSFIAGLLTHAKEITAVTNQWVNSYKRLVPGYEAPIYVSWARVSGSALIRIPSLNNTHPWSSRLEYRAPDPACNPYLAFSVMLAAGLDGVKNKMQPPPAADRNIEDIDKETQKNMQISTLPGSLHEAIQSAKESELLRRTLGDHIFASFIQNKTIEWERYREHVSDYELKRYLPLL